MVAKYRFTDETVSKLRHRAKRYDEVEPGKTHLAIRVERKPSTTKAWYYLYRFENAKGRRVPRRMKLGDFPAVNTEQARELLLTAKWDKDHGVDPARKVAEAAERERLDALEAITVSAFAEQYLEAKIRGKFASAAATENMFRRNILPTIGDMEIKKVRKPHINSVLAVVRERGAFVMANRTKSACVAFFEYAVDEGLIESNPCYGVRRTTEKPRDRFLSPREISTFWGRLGGTDIPPLLQLALRFLLVTGQRRGEVIGASYQEFDRERAVWEIPAGRMKKERTHLVPLSGMALDIFGQIEKTSGDGTYLFPSPSRPGLPYNPNGLSDNVLLHNGAFGFDEPWTVHDLRRTVNTEMAPLLIPQYIIDRVQSRVDSGVGSKHYNRYDYFSEKKDALDKWAERLTILVSDKPKVVTLNAG